MVNPDFRALIHSRFDSVCTGRLDRDTVTGIIALAEEYNITEDIEKFLSQNPDATLEATADFADQTAPEEIIEIVDDDELDEEERNPAVYED